MVLSPRLEISQKQKLMMNPQMRQAIELLQLTNIQLTDMLKREMEQNPFLAFDADHFRDSGNGEAPRAVTVDGTSGVGLSDKIEAVRVDFAGGEGGDVAAMLENRAAEESGLTPHILRQIAEEISDRDIAALAVELTGQFHRQRGNVSVADFFGNLAQNMRCQAAFFGGAVFQHGGDIAALPAGEINPHRFNLIRKTNAACAVYSHCARRFTIAAIPKMVGIKGQKRILLHFALQHIGQLNIGQLQ